MCVSIHTYVGLCEYKCVYVIMTQDHTCAFICVFPWLRVCKCYYIHCAYICMFTFAPKHVRSHDYVCVHNIDIHCSYNLCLHMCVHIAPKNVRSHDHVCVHVLTYIVHTPCAYTCVFTWLCVCESRRETSYTRLLIREKKKIENPPGGGRFLSINVRSHDYVCVNVITYIVHTIVRICGSYIHV